MKCFMTTLTGLFLMTVLATNAEAVTITHGSTTINMDFVSVGNPGNADYYTGYGGVNYSYNIGKYEVTKSQWDAVNDANITDRLNDEGYWNGDQPVASISWYEAAMFCNWLTSGDVNDGAYVINSYGEVTAIDRDSARNTYDQVYVLPTPDEWFKAAHYDASTSEYYNYPVSTNTVPDGIDFNGDTTFDAVFNDGYNQGCPNDVYNAGDLSPYGTMGQGGNVAEWNESFTGSYSSYRGGTFDGGSVWMKASLSWAYQNPSHADYIGIGFRVVSIPEPGSTTLLLCGLAILPLLRKRYKPLSHK